MSILKNCDYFMQVRSNRLLSIYVRSYQKLFAEVQIYFISYHTVYALTRSTKKVFQNHLMQSLNFAPIDILLVKSCWQYGVRFGGLNHHHHYLFVPGVLTNVFIVLEPGLFSPQAGVSRFLQPNLHIERSCASAFFNPLTSMSFSNTPFHLFLVAFFEPSNTILFLLSLELFHQPSFAHAQTIAISALLRTPLSSPHLSYH